MCSFNHLSLYFILFAFLMLPTTALAVNKYDQGAFYFAQGDYISALSLWSPLAAEGNSAAQYSIGLLYDQGKGVKKDPQRALKYFQSASDQDLAVAQYYLGMKYFAGLDVTKNMTKAHHLLNKAAQSDYLNAQFQLANIYDQNGKQQDLKLATRWFTRAAENGYGPAQHSLAARFLTGRGTALNLKQGIFWLEKAAEQRDPDAMRDLGFMYYKGMGVDKDFHQARDLLIPPAEEGSGLALFVLGEIYTTGGHGIRKDLYQAKKWFQRSKNAGYKEAQQKLTQLNKHSISPIKPVKKVPKAMVSTHSHLENDAIRFKQLDDQAYFLQLLIARQYSSISQLTEQYTDEHIYFFKIKKDNEDLYVLIYGYFKSYDEAKKAIKLLPETFQLKSKPWIRQVKHLKSIVYIN